jgi:mono/diheme cytochrome c family protein
LKHATKLTLAALLSSLTFAASAADSQRIGPGQQFYEKTCAKCHEAGIGPVIKGRGFPPATYMVIARNGMNAMPAFRVTDIDDATLLELGEYLSKTEVTKAAEPAKK